MVAGIAWFQSSLCFFKNATQAVKNEKCKTSISRYSWKPSVNVQINPLNPV